LVNLPSQPLETDEPSDISVISEPCISTPSVYTQKAREASIISENNTDNNSNFTENLFIAAAPDSVNNPEKSVISDDYSGDISDYLDKTFNTSENISFSVTSH